MKKEQVIHVNYFSIRKREPMQEISEIEERKLIKEIFNLIDEKGYLATAMYSVK